MSADAAAVSAPPQVPIIESAPDSYAPGAGEVHVWTIKLESDDSALEDAAKLLSEVELERARRFAFEKDRARFISCRTALRTLLARYTGEAAEAIAFQYGPQGKPGLAGDAGWQFNVSHSRDAAAIAISRFDQVGIDLEWIDPGFPRTQVARDVLTREEGADLDALPAEDHPAHFFQLWTLKEAVLKVTGRGLSVDPRSIQIRLDPKLSPVLVCAPPGFQGATLHCLPLVAGHAAAMAVMAPVTKISYFAR